MRCHKTLTLFDVVALRGRSFPSILSNCLKHCLAVSGKTGWQPKWSSPSLPRPLHGCSSTNHNNQYEKAGSQHRQMKYYLQILVLSLMFSFVLSPTSLGSEGYFSNWLCEVFSQKFWNFAIRNKTSCPPGKVVSIIGVKVACSGYWSRVACRVSPVCGLLVNNSSCREDKNNHMYGDKPILKKFQ